MVLCDVNAMYGVMFVSSSLFEFIYHAPHHGYYVDNLDPAEDMIYVVPTLLLKCAYGRPKFKVHSMHMVRLAQYIVGFKIYYFIKQL